VDAPQDADIVSDRALRGFVGYNMKRAFNVLQADLARTLQPFELRMVTFSALVLIVDNPGLRQAQLADALAVERPNLVVVIDQLEQRNLITRAPIPTDRRAYALKATPTGRRLCEQAVKAVAAHEARALAALDPAARTALAQTLMKVEAATKALTA
jgi:DNA-binding MarR family transcriptional regulator